MKTSRLNSSDNRPLISVIVPIYKVEAYLRRCVDSILAQTFIDFEVILVDDGSPDGCPAICDEYAEKDSRIHVIHQKNGGLSAARNAGIDWAFANSNSEWISFVDSDDYVAENYLQTLYNNAIATNADISVVKHAVIEKYVPLSDESIVEVLDSVEAMEKLCSIKAPIHASAWAKLYRKEKWCNIRFPHGKCNEDTFVQHWLFSDSVIAFSSARLYGYFQRSDSIMHIEKSLRFMDCLEAYIDRLVMFSHNNKYAHLNTLVVRQFWYWYFNYIPQELTEEHIEKIRKLPYKRIFLKFHFQDTSRSMRERVALAILLLFPEMYKQIWGKNM